MKRELSRNWEYITVGKDPARAELICKNLQRWGFETFILKHKTVTSPLRCYVYVRKDYGKTMETVDINSELNGLLILFDRYVLKEKNGKFQFSGEIFEYHLHVKCRQQNW